MPPGSLTTQWGWCLYLLSPFLQAARTAAISFCTQEAYSVVGFLSFPVSFLPRGHQCLLRAAADKNDVVVQEETDKHISRLRPRPFQGRRELGLGVETEEPEGHACFPGAVFLPDALSLVGHNNNILHLYGISRFSKVASHCTEAAEFGAH